MAAYFLMEIPRVFIVQAGACRALPVAGLTLRSSEAVQAGMHDKSGPPDVSRGAQLPSGEYQCAVLHRLLSFHTCQLHIRLSRGAACERATAGSFLFFFFLFCGAVV
jgi:hypothetical protein